MKRLVSFLKSDGKTTMLRYFYAERKAMYARWLSKVMPHNPLRSNAGKINLSGQKSRLFGLHRSGLSSSMQYLRDLHNPKGVLLDAAVDRTFSAGNQNFTGYSEPWIGIIHVPPGVPEWMESKQSNRAVFDSDGWKRSIPYCLGLFTLSGYHRKHLEPLFKFPVENLYHPVEFPSLKWNYEKFAANRDKKIIHSGWWLRRVYSFYLLNVKGYRKILLVKPDVDIEKHFHLELEHMDDKQLITSQVMNSVTRIDFLSNKRYDELLSENIVFIDLIDASANNAIIECIARNTPILVNPIEPVVEYLGKDYPFYFNSLEEAARKAENMNLVRDAHDYLASYPFKNKLTGKYFHDSFLNSSIYQSL
jgi:hypothetical protein